MTNPEIGATNFEILLPKLGEYLLEEGLISSESLQAGLDYQKEKQLNGQKVLIGQALVSLDLISPEILDRVITKQIFDLHEALKTTNKNLEERVQIKTRDLHKRLVQIQTASQITQTAIETDHPEELLKRTVNLIVERFGYYSASIYLIDTQRKNAYLAETAGPFSESVKKKGQSVEVGSRSMVGWVAAHNQPRVTGNLREEFFYRIDDLLTESRSEACLPISVKAEFPKDRLIKNNASSYLIEQTDRTKVIGVLDVQHSEIDSFDSDALAVLQIIANHIASVLQNVEMLVNFRNQVQEIRWFFDGAVQLAIAVHSTEVYDILAQLLTKISLPSALYTSKETDFTGYEYETPNHDRKSVKVDGKNSIIVKRNQLEALLQDNDLIILNTGKETTYPQSLVEICNFFNQTIVTLIPIWTADFLSGFVLVGDDLSSIQRETVSRNYDLGSNTPSGDISSKSLATQLFQFIQLSSFVLGQIVSRQGNDKKAQAIDVISRINRYAIDRSDSSNVFEETYRWIREFIGDVDFQVVFYDPSTGSFDVRYNVLNGQATIENQEFSIPFYETDHPIQKVIKRKITVNESINGGINISVKDANNGFRAKSWMGIPIIFNGNTQGVLILIDYLGNREFNQEDQIILEIFAGQYASIVKSFENFDISKKLKNRDYRLKEFTTRIRREYDMHAIVELAATEIRNTLDLNRTKIEIDVETALPSTFFDHDGISAE